MYTNSNTLYTLCTFMKYTFCSIHLELKFIQKVHIFGHFLYSTWVTWVRFAIYAFCIHLYTFCIASMLPTLIWNRVLFTGLLIFRGKKKQNFAGFSGANSRKNRLLSRDFCGKKVEIRWKIFRFHVRKVKVRRKIGRLRVILAVKSQISKDIQRQILRKIGRFHRKFRGETSPRNILTMQETISKKSQFRWIFFGQISLKSINFASIWSALFNAFFLTGIIICSFNNSSLEKWAKINFATIWPALFYVSFQRRSE